VQIKALVVGATGIIGRGVCQALLDKARRFKAYRAAQRVSFRGRSIFLPTCSLVP
jgi:uncharacterized protein YbjT (DUF2867 family)